MCWATIKKWFQGGSDPDSPVEIPDKAFMPLFVRNATGHVVGTWEYLSLPDADKKAIRDNLKADCRDGETPAICFCLTPNNINGGTIADNMVATDSMLEVIASRCRDLVADGIAVIPCLYCDDPSGAMPRWWEISAHANTWGRVYNVLKPYLTGVVLSIESNEKAQSKAHLEGCINVMRSCFPGLELYGTHLQWQSGGRYSWDGGNAPANANIILMETRNDPTRGDGAMEIIKQNTSAAKATNPNIKIVIHEYNTNVNSAAFNGQRAYIRNSGIWGIG